VCAFAANVKEGDKIVIKLRGNLRIRDQDVEKNFTSLFYNSNMPNKAVFFISEVDK
jgi:hypothetical protein